MMAPRGAKPLTPAETNDFVQRSNEYVELTTRGLRWASQLTPTCQAAKARVEFSAAPMALTDFTKNAGDTKATIELQARAEENVLTRLAQVSEAVFEAIRDNCLDLSMTR